MTPTTIDTSKLAFASLLTTAKGAKQLPAFYETGDTVIWQPGDACEIPFEPSAYNDPEANRITLCLTPSQAMCETITALHDWCKETLSKTPALIGIQLTPEQIADRYVSCIKKE